MKTRILLCMSLFAGASLFAQSNDMASLLRRIRAVNESDSAYMAIRAMGKAVLPQLVEQIPDSSFSVVKDPCDSGLIRNGDLALYLVNAIEPIAFYNVTGIQYDVFGCGPFPYSFLEAVGKDRAGFCRQYTEYRSRQGPGAKKHSKKRH